MQQSQLHHECTMYICMHLCAHYVFVSKYVPLLCVDTIQSVLPGLFSSQEFLLQNGAETESAPMASPPAQVLA